MIKNPADHLTNEYYTFSVGENRDKILEQNLTLTDLLSELKREKIGFVMQKVSQSQVSGIFCYEKSFIPDMISGRTFNESDFENNSNTVLVSDELRNDIVDIDGKKMFLFENNYYEVIGVYQRSSNKINTDAYAYYNLHSNNIIENDNIILGQYNVDAGKSTKLLVNKVDRFCSVNVLRTVNDNTNFEKIQKVISVQSFTMFFLLLVLIMLTLNAINTTANWIDNRKSEIVVRKITGATDIAISAKLIGDYVLLTSISFTFGIMIAYLISRIKTSIFVGFDFSPTTVVIAYVSTLTLSLLCSVIMLMFFNKNSISEARWK